MIRHILGVERYLLDWFLWKKYISSLLNSVLQRHFHPKKRNIGRRRCSDALVRAATERTQSDMLKSVKTRDGEDRQHEHQERNRSNCLEHFWWQRPPSRRAAFRDAVTGPAWLRWRRVWLSELGQVDIPWWNRPCFSCISVPDLSIYHSLHCALCSVFKLGPIFLVPLLFIFSALNLANSWTIIRWLAWEIFLD